MIYLHTYIIRPKLSSGFKETVGFKENRQNLTEMYMAETVGWKVNLVILMFGRVDITTLKIKLLYYLRPGFSPHME